MDCELHVISTELGISNVLEDRTRLKHKIELVTNPWPKQKRYTISHPAIVASSEFPKAQGYSTQIHYMPSTRINTFRVMEFENNKGGVKVQGYSDNKIKPIRSNKKQQRASVAKSSRLELHDKRYLPAREKSSILDKNNLFLVSFLKNKVKRISKLIEKTSQDIHISKLPHFPREIQTGPVEYNYRTLSKRSSSVVGVKRYSRLRSSKGYEHDIVPW